MKTKMAHQAARIGIALAGSMAVQAENVLPIHFLFDRDPHLIGWEQRGAYVGNKGEFVGGWKPGDGKNGRGCLFLQKGVWVSPPIKVIPETYIRIRFSARLLADGFYMRFST